MVRRAGGGDPEVRGSEAEREAEEERCIINMYYTALCANHTTKGP